MAEGGPDLTITNGRGFGSGVVGAIGVSHDDSPSSISEKLRGLKSNFSDRRGRRGADVGKNPSAVTTPPSLFSTRLCATRMMTSNGDRGYVEFNRTSARAPHHQGANAKQTRLDLTHDREDQILTEALLRTEGDQDEGGDQVKQGALDKHASDPVAHDSGCVDSTTGPYDVVHDVSRQVDIESTRQGEVGDYRDVRGGRPGIRVRRGNFLVVGGGYAYCKGVRQGREQFWDGRMHRRRT